MMVFQQRCIAGRTGSIEPLLNGISAAWPHLLLIAGILSPWRAWAQAVPPEAIAQFERVVGDRVEAVTILGGDHAAAGGLYSFRGGQVANISITKFGGGGDVAAMRPLGLRDWEWAPVLEGNLGFITAKNEFPSSYLAGNEMHYDTFGLQAGGGVRIRFSERISLSPTLSGIYGRTKNEFVALNDVGELVKPAASGQFVDWEIETWSLAPALEFKYEWGGPRTAFAFASRYNYFHTESFHSSSPLVAVSGDSHTWENKLEVDAPLGWRVFGRELRTGGFVGRTELFGGVADGLNADHVYTFNGRFVIDLTEVVWKTRWLGVGATYFLADHFSGWSAGLDVRFQF